MELIRSQLSPHKSWGSRSHLVVSSGLERTHGGQWWGCHTDPFPATIICWQTPVLESLNRQTLEIMGGGNVRFSWKQLSKATGSQNLPNIQILLTGHHEEERPSTVIDPESHSLYIKRKMQDE